MFTKKNYSLLPFIREDLSGLNSSSGQFIGWEIIKFNIQEKWGDSQGDGVIVGVIDTGCDLFHNDLKNNLINGVNIIESKKDPMDDNGHGTHVSSTIAAENNNIGMVGISPKTKIRPIKALDKNGNGSSQNIVKGIKWAIDQKVDIITMSLGSKNNDPQIHELIKNAYNKNIIVFCAAGNSGEKESIMYPAKYKETIAIGAIDQNLKRTSFTCSGEELDFLAPGHNIFGAIPGDGYSMMSGTSMSNPFAVGCASLLISKLKKENKKYNTEYIRNIFQLNAMDVSNVDHRLKKYQGYGIIRPI